MGGAWVAGFYFEEIEVVALEGDSIGRLQLLEDGFWGDSRHDVMERTILHFSGPSLEGVASSRHISFVVEPVLLPRNPANTPLGEDPAPLHTPRITHPRIRYYIALVFLIIMLGVSSSFYCPILLGRTTILLMNFLKSSPLFLANLYLQSIVPLMISVPLHITPHLA